MATTKKQAAEARAKAVHRDDRMLAALAVEREGYVIRGLKDRVAQVDEQIAYYGGE